MNDPELVVLDEPMSGLDPIGRKEVRDLILELREHGKTVFFSTHILADVEAITDRVAIVARGQLQAQGTPARARPATRCSASTWRCGCPRRRRSSSLDRGRRARAARRRRAVVDAAAATPTSTPGSSRAHDAGREGRSRSRRATRRSRTCSCARSRAPTAAPPRRAARDRPDLGDRAQHVPRGGADPRALRHPRARRRREPARARPRRDVDRTRRRASRATSASPGISLFGSLTAIFLGVFLLYTEVQRRTIHAIVSKPIERWEFVDRQVPRHGARADACSSCCSRSRWSGCSCSRASASRDRGGQGDRAGVVRGADGRGDRDLLLVVLDAVPVGHLRARDVGDRPGHARHRGGAATRAAPWIRATTRVALEIVPDLHLFAVSGRTVEGDHVSVHGDFVSWGYVAARACTASAGSSACSRSRRCCSTVETSCDFTTPERRLYVRRSREPMARESRRSDHRSARLGTRRSARCRGDRARRGRQGRQDASRRR